MKIVGGHVSFFGLEHPHLGWPDAVASCAWPVGSDINFRLGRPRGLFESVVHLRNRGEVVIVIRVDGIVDVEALDHVCVGITLAPVGYCTWCSRTVDSECYEPRPDNSRCLHAENFN